MQRVIDASPHVFAHNIETVERLQKQFAIDVQITNNLGTYKKERTKMYTKSSIMVGGRDARRSRAGDEDRCHRCRFFDDWVSSPHKLEFKVNEYVNQSYLKNMKTRTGTWI